MKFERVNMGEIILQKMREKGLKKSQFARLLGKNRQDLDRAIFNKRSLDTEFLCEISEKLDCNFFDYIKCSEKDDSLKVVAKLSLEIEGENKSREMRFEFKKT